MLAGALLLEACVPRFPAAAVHVAVVDPGVGTARRPLCVVDRAGRRLVGPDNGLLTPFLGPGSAAYLLSDPELVPRDPSPTFHGRDLFAPVAAWLAGGGDPGSARASGGRPGAAPRALGGADARLASKGRASRPTRSGTWSRASGAPTWPTDTVAAVTVAGRPARLVVTFGDGAPGELLALWGSGGRLEIAVREGSAAREPGIGRGAPVLLALGQAYSINP